WDVVGLLNWGTNYSLDGASPTLMPDEARTYRVELAALGLDPQASYLASEFWSERCLGEVSGALDLEVPAHGQAVVTLRRATGRPQLVGHNRHFTQGATDLVNETWDEAARTLSIELRVDQGEADAVPFEYRVRVHAPPGWTLSSSELGGGSVEQQQGDLVVHHRPT